MKKMMMLMMAAMTIGFTSCGNKSQQAAPADTDSMTQVDSSAITDVETAINVATAQLSEQIEAKDVSKLQQAIEAVQTKISELLKENPDAAKEYVAQIQNFLKENAEKIKAVAGDNAAIQAAFNALTAAPAETIVSGLTNAVNGAQEATDAAVDAAKDKADEAVDAAKEKAGEAVDAAADKAKEAMGL